MTEKLASIEAVIEDARAGRMVILVDSAERENEGDLFIPAAKATPEAINFMVTHGRGLVCLSLTHERAEELELELMPSSNQPPQRTAFTVSIEAREGVSTGISAHDRARTVEVAVDPKKDARDIATPGHIFPLIARDGGVLVRAGHTEAAVDLARLAGFAPAGVICEVMKDDGSMARLSDLATFGKKHDIKIATIADLIAYRRRYDQLIHRLHETSFESDYGGEFKTFIYENKIDNTRHAALIKGDISGEAPVLVRMHVANVREDMLAETGARAHLLRRSMEIIAEEKRGVLVLLDPGRRPVGFQDSDVLERRGRTGAQSSNADTLVEYGAGAQILIDLGIRNMILLSDRHFHIVGLEGYGLHVAEQRPILGEADTKR